jgi:hypothetical protein
MKFIMGAILALTLSSVTMACEGTPPPNCECDQATGTYVTISASAAASSSSRATGGNASATGGNATQGQSQSLNNSGNSTASATGGNISSGAVRNTNNNSNVANGGAGGNASASVASGAVKNTNNQANSNTASGNDTTVNYQAPKEYRNPVNTAYSAPLTSGLDTCVGSVSAGAQTQILGLTFGSTKRDTRCELIKQTHLLVDLHQERAACFRAQLGKEGAEIREAMKEAGAECPPQVEALPVVVQPDTSNLVTQDQLREVENRITTKALQK